MGMGAVAVTPPATAVASATAPAAAITAPNASAATATPLTTGAPVPPAVPASAGAAQLASNAVTAPPLPTASAGVSTLAGGPPGKGGAVPGLGLGLAAGGPPGKGGAPGQTPIQITLAPTPPQKQNGGGGNKNKGGATPPVPAQKPNQGGGPALPVPAGGMPGCAGGGPALGGPPTKLGQVPIGSPGQVGPPTKAGPVVQAGGPAPAAAAVVHTSIHGTVLQASNDSLTLRNDAGVTTTYKIAPEDLAKLDMPHLLEKHVATGKTLDLVFQDVGGTLYAKGYSHPPSPPTNPPAPPSAVPHSAIHGTIAALSQTSLTLRDDSGALIEYEIRPEDLATMDLQHLQDKHLTGKALNLVFTEKDGKKQAISYNHPA